MTGTMTAKWNLPTVRQSGLPADPADVKGVEVALAVVGGPFSPLNVVPSDTLELVVPDLSPGDYLCRLVPIDTADVRGAETELPFQIADDTPLGPVENATATVT